MTSVPRIAKAQPAEASSEPKGSIARYAMWACCAVMALPIVALLAGGGSLSGVFSNAGALLPLLACLGLHVVMHRVMGRSCHDEKNAQSGVPDGESEPALVAPTKPIGIREAS